MLVILGGLPGTGKSTIGKKLAEKIKAVYLRIDSIEQAIKQARHVTDEKDYDIGPEGYVVANAIARDNLEIGLTVIADSVNPINITREAWRHVAKIVNSPCVEIEIICTNLTEHKKRVETRESKISGLHLPSWQDVLSRDYELWQTKNTTIDTAINTVDEAVEKIIEIILNNTKISV